MAVRSNETIAMNQAFFVYVMSNKSHTLYTGSTGELLIRVQQHKGLEVSYLFQVRVMVALHF